MSLDSYGLEFSAKGWTQPISVAREDIPRDPVLPELPRFLDVGYTADVLEHEIQDHIPSFHKLTDKRIVYLRYKPSRYCNVFFYLTFENKSGSSSHSCLVAGKSVSANLAGRTPDNVSQLHLPTVDAGALQYTLFPVDPRIPSLACLVDRATLQQKLQELLVDPDLEIVKKHEGTPWGQVLSYRPERYFLMKLTTQPGAKNRYSDSNQNDLVLRLFHSRQHATTAWQVMQLLWSNSVHGLETPLVPKPLGWSEQDQACIYAIAHGHLLSEQLHSSHTLELISVAARTLGHIHSCPVPSNIMKQLTVVEPQTMLNSICAVRKFLDKISDVDKNRLDEVIDELQRTIPMKPSNGSLLHGDFSPKQILLDDQKATTIDYSGVYGDPHIDVGNFLARLRNSISSARYDPVRTEFVKSYQTQNGERIDNSVLTWFETAAMVKDAFIPIKKLRKNWRQQFSAKLALALAHLSHESGS